MNKKQIAILWGGVTIIAAIAMTGLSSSIITTYCRATTKLLSPEQHIELIRKTAKDVGNVDVVPPQDMERLFMMGCQAEADSFIRKKACVGQVFYTVLIIGIVSSFTGLGIYLAKGR